MPLFLVVLFHMSPDRSEGLVADRSQEEGELSGENLICVDSMG